MAITVSDILVTPARVWVAPSGEALPDETTVAFGAAWGGNWEEWGATLTAVTVAHTREEKDVEVEQFTAPIARFVVKEGYTIETSLAQLTPDNLADLLSGVNTATAAGAAQRAFDELKAGGEFTIAKKAVGLEGRYRHSSGTEYPVRVFLPIATIMLNGNLQFTKADVTGVPFQAKALADTTAAEGQQLFRLHRVTAPATTES